MSRIRFGFPLCLKICYVRKNHKSNILKGGCPRMPFFPSASLYSKNYPKKINYMPVVTFLAHPDFEKIAIPGHPPAQGGDND